MALTPNVVLLPAHIVDALGCETIDGAVFTVSVAAFEVTGEGQVPETTHRYRKPLFDETVELSFSVSLVQLVYEGLLPLVVIFAKPLPVFTCH